MSTYEEDVTATETSFSTDKALQHVSKLSKEPRGVGFLGHTKAQHYITSQL